MDKIKNYSFLIWPLVVLVIFFGTLTLRPWQNNPKETITVSAQGGTDAVPTVAKISGNIQTTAQTAEAAQSQNQEQAGNLIDVLKEAGLEDKNIQTTNISVNPQYNYEARPPQIINYQANTNITVTIEDLETAGETLNLLTQNGTTSLFGPNLQVDDDKLEEARQEAREEAISAAREKASQLAELSGRSLGKVVSIQEADGGFSIPEPFPIAVGSEDFETRSSQIEPGQREITINLTVDFELK